MGVFRKLRVAVRSRFGWTGLLLGGALLTVVGLTLAGTAPILGTQGALRTRSQQHIGGAFVVVGWVVLGASIHAIGRASIDEGGALRPPSSSPIDQGGALRSASSSPIDQGGASRSASSSPIDQGGDSRPPSSVE
jgi:hypothetical protein